MKIAVVGAGYVGLSIATLLSTIYQVIIVDINIDKVSLINERVSPIKDEYIERYFKNKKLELTATNDYKIAFESADFIIIAVPTNFDETTNSFDTKSIKHIIGIITALNPTAVIVIKSTVPIGFTQYVKKTMGVKHLVFSPEFMREKKALFDNIYPSRIIMGVDLLDVQAVQDAKRYVELLKQCLVNKETPIMIVDSREAEAIKLFSNAYLALRVSFFNELDTFAEMNELNSKNIIKGVCLDPRIGDYYNNPSFGFGGYCLPKDTKQLLSDYSNNPQNLISAVIKSNQTRINHISNRIIKLANSQKKVSASNSNTDLIIGVYRLTMKSDSDNFRQSAVIEVINCIFTMGAKILIYEPLLENGIEILNGVVINDIEKFKNQSDIIIANRYCNELDNVRDLVYTRDIFGRD